MECLKKKLIARCAECMRTAARRAGVRCGAGGGRRGCGARGALRPREWNVDDAAAAGCETGSVKLFPMYQAVQHTIPYSTLSSARRFSHSAV